MTVTSWKALVMHNRTVTRPRTLKSDLAIVRHFVGGQVARESLTALWAFFTFVVLVAGIAR